jgi:Tol biopolymer transport system component
MRARCAWLVATIVCLSATWAHAQDAETVVVSTSRDGRSSGKNSDLGGVSTTGRFVAFDSRSPEIVKGDTNGARDVFLWDREKGRTTRVNVSSAGRETRDGGCHCKISSRVRAMSDDGTVVGFITSSPTLDEDDRDENPDGFVHDTRTGETQMVTGNDRSDVSSDVMAISPTGRFVVYELIPEDGDATRYYFWDRQRGGRKWINLETGAHDAFTGEVVSISATGDRLTFVTPDYSPDNRDQVWMMEMATGIVTQVSVSSDEQPANNSSYGGEMSADGRYVAFTSYADNLMGLGGDRNLSASDGFLRDLETGTTSLVSVRDEDGMQSLEGRSGAGDVSDDGCRVLFGSDASDLVEGDTNGQSDIFVRDMCAETTTRVNVASDGSESHAGTVSSALSGDGAWVAFQSRAVNMSPDDTDRKYDVFLRGPLR